LSTKFWKKGGKALKMKGLREIEAEEEKELKIKDVFIDKMRIVGNFKEDGKELFASLVRREIGIELMREGFEPRGKIFGEADFEYSQQKAKSLGIRPFWIEFNPQKLTEEQIKFLKEKIVGLLWNAEFTRLDITFDLNFNPSAFEFIQDNPTKMNVWFTQNREIETMYFGVRGAEKFLRIYNKKEQLKEEFGQEVEDETLWRLEWELRRNAVKILNDDKKTLFDGLKIVKPDLSSIEKIQDRAMLFYLQHHPEGWSELARNTRYKYREMLKKCKGTDVTGLFIEAYKKKKGDLQKEVADWLSYSNKH
jgi:hypothetical protein